MVWSTAPSLPMKEKAIAQIAPGLTVDEESSLRARVDQALISDLGFEKRLRALPLDLRMNVVSDESMSLLIGTFALPEEPSDPPDISAAIEILGAHAKLLKQNHIQELIERSNSYLLSRSEAGAPFGDADTQVLMGLAPDVAPLLRETIPALVDRFQSDSVEAALLVPS